MRGERKELIRETAITVMAEYGYHNATTDRIAQQANLAVGTIYNYFRNKEEILDYIFQVELNKRKIAFVKEQKSAKPLFEKLEILLNIHFNEIASNLPVGQILVREQQNPRIKENGGIQAFLNEVPSWIEDLLKTAIQQGEIRICAVDILASAIFGAIQGVAAKAVFAEDEKAAKRILQSAATEILALIRYGIQKI